MKDQKLPEGFKVIELGEIFSEIQAQQILSILYSNKDSIERVRELKDYLQRFKTDLEKEGVVPDFLAYQLEHLFGPKEG